MKILLYAVQPFKEPTGLCRYTATLVLALKERGFDVKIILGSWQVDYYEHVFGISGSEIIRSRIKNTAVSRYFTGIFDASNIFKREKFDVIHFVSPNLISAFSRSGPVVTVHDLYAFTNPKSMRLPNRLVNRLISAASILTARRIIAISNETQKDIVEFFPRVKCRVSRVYQPVAAIFSLATEGMFNDDLASLAGKSFILSVAGHRAHKRLDLAMASVAEAISCGELPAETRLVIVGGRGTESASLHKMANMLDLKVDFISNVEDDIMVKLYRDCIALLITSESEGFCLPLAEAITLGVRAICTDIPILREVGGEAAIFFELGASPAQVARALGSAASAPRPAPDRSRFNGKLYADRVLSAYEATIGSGARSDKVY